MKIALVGITGTIRSQIALEAKKRGHVRTITTHPLAGIL
jgi:putative NADH-flavin reductase